MTEYSKTAKCLYCGNEFVKTTSRHKYCSGRCKEAYRISKLDLHQGTCKGCGKPITYKLIGGKPSKQYCCAACQVAHTVPVKVLTCVDCGEQFEFRGRTTKLRCDKCWHKHRSDSVMAERALKNPTVKIGVGSGGAQNLDTEADELRQQINARRREYYAKNAEKLRAAARSRYRAKMITGKDKCDICGFCDDQDALIVHHKDMDRSNDDTSNLVVICANCHTALHKFIKKVQKTEQLTAPAIFELFKNNKAELKERNEAGKPDKATRTEGSEESESGATHSDTSSTDMSHHEAAPDTDSWDIQPDLGF